MKTLNELERAKKDKIKNLSMDETERYIMKLNKEMADAWGNIDNYYNMDVATMLKNNDLCEEAVELLKDKYRMELLVAATRNNALVDKHLSDIEDMRKYRLDTLLNGVICNYWQTSHNILILTQFLNLLYEYYWISPADIECFIDNTTATAKCKISVINELDMEKTPVYSLYNQHFMSSVEITIKHMASIIDKEMIFLKQLVKLQYDKDTAYDDGTAAYIEGMIDYQKLSRELIAEYEELKNDGFMNAKDIEAEIYSKALNKDKDSIMELFKEGRPSYDVNNFIFIPPQAHIESMKKYHPDWKYDHQDNDYEDDGSDTWYADVTNPLI